jgi:hypothetical protein
MSAITKTTTPCACCALPEGELQRSARAMLMHWHRLTPNDHRILIVLAARWVPDAETRPAAKAVTAMKTLLLAAVLAIVPGLAHAQAPFPGAVNVDGGWVPCSHPIAIAAGRGCNTTPAPAPAPAPVPTQMDPDCRDLNPYLEPERAAACAARPLPPGSVPTFLIGRTYALGSADVRCKVLGLSQDIDGVQVVTVRWLVGDGRIDAFRTPPTPGGATSFSLVQ